jgi:flagellar M-ring protein FliF
MAQIQSLVQTAVGYDKDRGDQVTVVNVKFPTADDAEGVAAASPLMGFDKNDIMRSVELGVLALVSILILFFVLRPLIRSAAAGAQLMAAGGHGLITTRVVTTADGQPMGIDSATGQPLALPGPDIEQKIDIARIEGQVKASSIKRISEFVDKHPEESVSILRSWLHESA